MTKFTPAFCANCALSASALLVLALASGNAPALAQQAGGSGDQEVYVDLGRWVILQNENARSCELRLTGDTNFILRYQMADGRAAVLGLERRAGRFFTGMIGNVEWAFDDTRFAGFQASDGYSLSAGSRDIAVGFRAAKYLRVTHGEQEVARIDLKTSSAGFRLLKQCSEQWRYIPWYRRLANANYRELPDARSARAARTLPPPIERGAQASPSQNPALARERGIAPPLKNPQQTTPGRGALNPAAPVGARAINASSWINDNDALPWPSRGFGRGEGILRYTLTIDKEGRAQGCEVDRSTGHRRLDRKACRLIMERARFEPARGSDGTPATARYSGNVTFAGE